MDTPRPAVGGGRAPRCEGGIRAADAPAVALADRGLDRGEGWPPLPPPPLPTMPLPCPSRCRRKHSPCRRRPPMPPVPPPMRVPRNMGRRAADASPPAPPRPVRLPDRRIASPAML